MKENMRITYHQEGAFLYPDLTIGGEDKTIGRDEKEQRMIGKYGLLRKTYLKNHRPALYQELLFNGKLNEHLADIDEAATDWFIQLTDQMAKAQGITEALKAEDMLLWIQRMNAVREQADEIVLREMVYQ